MSDLPPTRLLIGNREFTKVNSATVWISVATEDFVVSGRTFFGKAKETRVYGIDHLGVRWDFLIVVDEIDSSIEPEFDLEFDGKTFPSSLDDIPGLELVDGGTSEFSAYVGADPRRLRPNRVRFGDWIDDRHIMMRWSARLEADERSRDTVPFLFEGPVAFNGIQMSVMKEEDAVPFLSRLLPALDQSRLDVEWGPEIIGKEGDGSRWRPVTWYRKRG